MFRQDEVGADIGQRPQDELALRDAGMGQMQFGGLDHQFAEVKEIEIDGSGNVSCVGSRPTEHFFDGRQ